MESAVQVVERWMLARLRHQRFSSVADVNGALPPLRQRLNQRPVPEAARMQGQRLRRAGRAGLAGVASPTL